VPICSAGLDRDQLLSKLRTLTLCSFGRAQEVLTYDMLREHLGWCVFNLMSGICDVSCAAALVCVLMVARWEMMTPFLDSLYEDSRVRQLFVLAVDAEPFNLIPYLQSS